MNLLKELEERTLKEGQEWTRQLLEKRAQAQADCVGAVCPQSGCLLKYRQRQPMTLMTCVGKITIHAWSGFSKALQARVHPLGDLWGLKPHQQMSPELEDRLVFTATTTNSYQRAAKVATRWGTAISDDTVHAAVQRVGERVPTTPLLRPPPRPKAKFSLVIMMDGWMVRQRGPDWGAGKRKKAPVRINWKEVKSAVIYRLETRTENASGRGHLVEKYVVAMPPDTSPVDFGTAVQAEAGRRGLAEAEKVYVVIDGALWLWNLATDRFSQADHLLDFHHASEHLWAIAHELYGPGTPAGQCWAKGLLHSLRHGQEEEFVRTLEQLLQPKPQEPSSPPEISTPPVLQEDPDLLKLPENTSDPISKTLRVGVEYFKTHRDHLHYERNANQGAPVGSGSVESLCGQLQNRFKRTGQFWSPIGLRNLLSLDVLHRNNDLHCLWN